MELDTPWRALRTHTRRFWLGDFIFGVMCVDSIFQLDQCRDQCTSAVGISTADTQRLTGSHLIALVFVVVEELWHTLGSVPGVLFFSRIGWAVRTSPETKENHRAVLTTYAMRTSGAFELVCVPTG